MPQLAIGINGLPVTVELVPILNVAKTARSWDIVDNSVTVSGADVWSGGYLDSNGDLANPLPSTVTTASFYFNLGSATGAYNGGYSNAGKQFTIKWDGTATASRLLFSGSSSIQTINSNEVRVTFGTSGEGNCGVTFAITDRFDPPTNIRIYETQFESAVAAGKRLRPDWVEWISQFKRLRVMDWMMTNNSLVEDYEDIADESYYRWGKTQTLTSSFGPKAGFPLAVICELAEDTGCDVQICIPPQSSDSCIQSILDYFNANFPRTCTLILEFMNEHWNSTFTTHYAYCFTQGQAIWPGDASRNLKWYGYRAAQVMKMAIDTFGSISGASWWRGVFSPQFTNSAVATANLVGINYWRANVLSPADSIAVNELFSEIHTAGYFGDVLGPQYRPTSVTQGAIPTVTHAANQPHGFSNGQEIHFSVNSGMTELDGAYATVTVVDTITYTIDIDTTAYSAWVASDRNFATKAPVFRLMDDSAQANIDDSVSYPTKYTLFNSVMTESFSTGTGTWDNGTITTVVSIASLKNTYWPALKTIADANGLDLGMYEGGLHYCGSTILAGFSGEPQFTEFLTATSHSAEVAECYDTMYRAFLSVGGRFPVKFVDCGHASQFGSWGMVRFWPDDNENPVALATYAFNANTKSLTVTT